MAYKAFAAPTGSGNTVFEGDVLNGYTSPDGKDVVIKFLSNDRGYTNGAFGRSHDKQSGIPLDVSAAKELRNELAELLEKNSATTAKFETRSTRSHFSLVRESEGTPLILGVHGTDARFGSSYHRGDTAALQKIVAEFDTVLKTIDEVVAGKAPA